ncbi:MAG: CRISPR-associated helicase Cas3' [Syntrophomonadaceae bacterium]|nr:CRISPR-associated helicase Cas3' [Syntrophomonadaceae bacterium]
MVKISKKARSLWAKKSKNNNLTWLPLVTHMADSAEIARKLWERWLPDGTKHAIEAGVSERKTAKQLFVFLLATHDIGKATPVNQAKKSSCSELDNWITERIQKAGLPMKPISHFARPAKTPHALATQILLEHAGCDKSIAVILGSHHGKPPDNATLNDCGIGAYAENYHLGKDGKEAWIAVQQELVDFALKLSGFSSIKELPQPGMVAQVLLSGLVIMADWVASNETIFPYIGLDDLQEPDAKQRAVLAWKLLDLPSPWEAGNMWMRSDLYRERFTIAPHAIQSITAKTAAAIQTPGILVLEAPMGMGKTEAALVTAEIFADKAKRRGVFFALPTQATSDGIFSRFSGWVKKLAEKLDAGESHSIRLVHGKAQLNEVYLKLADGVNVDGDEESGIMVHEWFNGRKKSMLDDFVVGTIDQLLLAALKQKHVMLRHLGLANKVVIIDECHAYDAYMNQYLNRILSWLGAYQVPVIVLSATLPTKKRMEVIEAYLNVKPARKVQADPLGRNRRTKEPPPEWISCCDYPLISFTDGARVGQTPVPAGNIVRDVRLEFLLDDMLLEKLEFLLSDGGCAGIIVNTVKRAQELAIKLCERFGKEVVRLLHSRYLAPDRAEKEKKLLEDLGKPVTGRQRPEKCIIVGTQVLEQSLDIDFDVLITDICPMDLLLQRIGRLHRHERNRPEKLRAALCLITGSDGDGFESGTEAIYGKYLLMRTKACLPQQIALPHDISRLVQDVYNDDLHPFPETPEYQKAASEHKTRIADKEKRARDFRINQPWQEGSLCNWLNTEVSDKSGEAAVRDGDESIEVILLQRKKNCKLYFLPWIENGYELMQNEIPDAELAWTLARCSVRLPTMLCAPWMIDNTIATLENLNREQLFEWQKSPWLKGELFLILDENNSANLCGYRLIYDQDLGLICNKEDKPDD